MMKIAIFKQNVMIRKRINQKSFRFQKCKRIVSWQVKNEREIVHIVNMYRAESSSKSLIFIFNVQMSIVKYSIFQLLVFNLSLT
jgi:hypothetical protein